VQRSESNAEFAFDAGGSPLKRKGRTRAILAAKFW
jgi:hypothetical protein